MSARSLIFSPAEPPAEHDGGRAEHDLQVLERRALADILEIVVQLLPDIIYAAVVCAIDLGPARDSGQHALAERVLLYLLAEGRENRELLRARAHDVHIADEYVPELRQLVKPELAQHAAYGRHARIVALGPDLGRRCDVDPHRAELVHRERPAAAVRMAPGVATR